MDGPAIFGLENGNGIIITEVPASQYVDPWNSGEWGVDTDYDGLNFWKTNHPSAGNHKLLIKNANGFIAIGISNPQQKLHVNGRIQAWNFLTPSDIKFKENVKPLEKALEVVLNLNPKSYNLKSRIIVPTESDLKKFPDMKEHVDAEFEAAFGDKTVYGLIAQEVREILPEVVIESEEGLSLDYSAFVPFLIGAIKDLNTEVETLKSEQKSSERKRQEDQQINPLLKKVELFQNQPNPFSEVTRIEYFIPEKLGDGAIYIYDLQGKQIRSEQLEMKDKGYIEINAKTLEPGMYIYALVVDGVELGSKRMIITD